MADISQPRKPSFQQFDYRIRPNKSTERQMFSEAFTRLSFFEPIENYRYIGFGATTFTDFILFHKTLNIQDMISIEKKEEYQTRLDFNKPYKCIQIKYGDANKVLPELRWEKRTIAWLDYDGVLTSSVLSDIGYVSAVSRSGSMLLVSVNVNGYKTFPGEAYKKASKRLRKKFTKQLDVDVLSGDIQGKHLEGDEMAQTCRRIILAQIEEALRNRNGLDAEKDQIKYQVLFNLVYKDGARMLTVGVIFYRSHEEDVLKQCQFENLGFVASDKDKLYEINVPVMTPRERQYINKILPFGDLSDGEKIGLSKDEIQNYARFYRYSPTFAEIELL